MKKKRSYSPEQIRQREERKQRFAEIVRRVADMTDEAREEFAAKLPIVMTCEGHPLSIRNTMLLAFQSAEPCSIVGGFRQWIRQGRCVRKGQHGKTILFPRTFGEKDADGSQAEETAASADKGKRRIAFLSGTVFDISQTDVIDTTNPRATSTPLFVPPSPNEPEICANCSEEIVDGACLCKDRSTGQPEAPTEKTIWNSDGTDGPVLICAPPPKRHAPFEPEPFAKLTADATPAAVIDGQFELLSQSLLFEADTRPVIATRPAERQLEFVPGAPKFLKGSSSHLKVVRIGQPEPSYKLDSPELAIEYWQRVIARQDWFDENKEHLVTLLLSTRYNILGYYLCSIGSVNEAIAHPHEVFRIAVAIGAYALIVMHNHPSGDPSPSQTDHSLTRRLKEGAELLQIKILDHVIAGATNRVAEGNRPYFSFREAGVL